MNRTAHARLMRGTSLLTIAICATPSFAQEQTALSYNLGTLTLKGEKVERDLMDTASSVSLYTAEDINDDAPGNPDVQAVIAGTPNVFYPENVSAPIIRGNNSEGPHTGANAFFGGTVPRATINLDGQYLDYNAFYFGATSAWDVESIEVFRGPQTTSQGANAIGGAIVVNTNDPIFEREGAYRLEFGDYDQNRASLMLNTPLWQDFAMRVALDYSARDTFINYNGAAFIQNEIGQNFETINGRAKLLWAPSEIAGLEVMLTYSRTDSTSPSSEGAAPPYDDLDSSTMFMPGWHQVSDTVILDANYNMGGMTLANKLQWTGSDIDRRVGVAAAGDADIQRDNWSNETTLTFGTPDDVLSGFAGLYYAHTNQDDRLNQGGISTFDDTKKNLGIYGEISWRFAPDWTLTGGLRYQRDEITRTGVVSPVFADSDLNYGETFDAVLPKISLAYEVNPNWTVGGLVSKGYNPGGVSLDFVSSRDWEEYKDETVWNYELFTRASLLEDRLLLTSNLFYARYKDYQYNIMQTVGGTTYIHTINADEAEAWGLEMAVDWQATNTLQLNAGLGLLATEITGFPAATSFEGNEFARAPGATLTLGASWDITDRFNLGGQVRFVDGYYSDTANSAAYKVGDYTLVDMRMSYAIKDGFEFYGFVNNIFDERAPVLKQAARGTVPFTQASMTSPRMIGIGIQGNF
ncbi:TonB-dependent receptor [Roseovarius sp. M141]|uniref:TonB-dependent receptor n=1 Tax=Roseovarius sp. M141 TaxID=2583806 RepID=UPI0020CEE006|nr:TonB-dependent receptor [Roseovarius sp. M141]MCQ0091954.1 TonB-dependent receptor [Roseovarius sp. M141]